MEENKSRTPHIVVLPLPADGHVKPFLNLSKRLSHFGLQITFVNSHRYHTRLHRHVRLPSFHSHFPNFHFASITDGVPSHHPITAPLNAFQLLISPTARSMVAAEFRELLAGISPQPTCVIADGIMSTIAVNVAGEFGVPVIAFRTYSASCTWATFFLTKLVEEGVIPVRDPG